MLGSLWAPWRMKYIKSALECSGKGKRGCFLCQLLRSKDDTRNLILYRSDAGFVVMNRFPYNNGHLMVVPNRHVADYEKLKQEESACLQQLVQLSLRALRLEIKPQGFNVGMNLGRVAGAGAAGHLHIHIVPRWNGDVNYMPVLAETKVINEHLEETYRRLRRRFIGRR